MRGRLRWKASVNMTPSWAEAVYTFVAVCRQRAVLLADVSTRPRWPTYCQELAALGCRSVLCIPFSWAQKPAPP